MSVWKGVFPAVTTKLAQDGKVDLAATQSSIDRLINNGVSGIIVLPMLGENASLLPNERESVIRAAIEVAVWRKSQSRRPRPMLGPMKALARRA